jgi:NAD(P)-dependent dehydrogenase (short-subunit alcohol dehydrogenase family)
LIADFNDEAGKKLEAELRSVAGDESRALFMHLNVADEKEWHAVADQIETKFGGTDFGGLDILVNNAGVLGLSPAFGPQNPEEASLESWRKVHEVNADGTFLGCKYAIRLMKQRGGAIVNMSSRSGLVGVPGAAAYASSKASVRNHTKSVALYCAKKGYAIRANSVHPASIMTSMWKSMLGTGADYEKNLREFSRDIPMKRFGTPEEVANAVLFLASDASSYITGSELNVDGGILAGTTTSPGEER